MQVNPGHVIIAHGQRPIAATIFWMTLALALIMALPLRPALAAPAEQGRVALVVGNSDYALRPLPNAVNDAQDMARTLSGLGFQVRLLLDTDQRSLLEAVDAFGQRLAQGGVGLFYYAGHGVQVEGENYLLPVHARIRSENDARFEGVNAGRVLARMEEARNGLNIVILDACRDNPFAPSYRSATAGLARMDAPAGTLIAYATAPGKTALDRGAEDSGPERNSIYTGALLQHLATPGLPIEEVFKRTRADVVAATRGRQVPWESSSLMGAFAFNGHPAELASRHPDQKDQSDPPPAQPDLRSALNSAVKRAQSHTPPQQESPPAVASAGTASARAAVNPLERLAGRYWITGPDRAAGPMASLLMLEAKDGRLHARIESPAGTRNRVTNVNLHNDILSFTWESQLDHYWMTTLVQAETGAEALSTEALPATFRRMAGNWGRRDQSRGFLVRAAAPKP
ncbi:MAG: caspase family protein [Desulfovibrionaceae bacterium]